MRLELATEIRKKVHMAKREGLDLCAKYGVGHPSSAFSCAEIVATLYYGVMEYDAKRPTWEERDRFILSKSHGATVLYPILADVGFFPHEELDTYLDNGSRLGAQLKDNIEGSEFAGGSLSIGLGVGAGIAYAGKADDKAWHTYVLVGDGECYEGSIWEAAMFAGHNKLDRLVAIVDRNDLVSTDFISRMLTQDPFADKWRAFNWDVYEVDGHDVQALLDVFDQVKRRSGNRPACILAATTKGNGVDSLASQPFMHGTVPQGKKLAQAYAQLMEKEKEVL